jgi:hypothetical protein
LQEIMGTVVQAHVGAVSRLEAAVAWEGHAVEEVDVVVVVQDVVEEEAEEDVEVEAVAETMLISHARR